ncbi:hypothetical protein HII31_11127 [Pseudocercospora fuligena]|uniref:Uncharacterized protein n=1 Tax=Pseudocercospora fuligena TaxID=685502 RepID=A0A8H6RAI8_9PEZI|nr:hypothetical protein HII31_11127 [Pseudocercospora fuligena]
MSSNTQSASGNLDESFANSNYEWREGLESYSEAVASLEVDSSSYNSAGHSEGYLPTPPPSFGTTDDEPMGDMPRHSAAHQDYGYLTPVSMAFSTSSMATNMPDTLSLNSVADLDFAANDIFAPQPAITPSMSACSTVGTDMSMLGLLLPKNVMALTFHIRTPPASPPASRSLPVAQAPPERLLTPLSQVMFSNEAEATDDLAAAFPDSANGAQRAGFATSTEQAVIAPRYRPSKRRRLGLSDESLDVCSVESLEDVLVSESGLSSIIPVSDTPNCVRVMPSSLMAEAMMKSPNISHPLATANSAGTAQSAYDITDSCTDNDDQSVPQSQVDMLRAKSLPGRLDTWMTEQAQNCPSTFEPEVMEERADTPSSVPNSLSEWTSNSSPRRPVAERISEYFRPREDCTEAYIAAHDTKNNTDAELGRIFDLLHIKGRISVAFLACRSSAVVQDAGIDISHSVICEWLGITGVDRDILDASSFRDVIHAIYDGIRETNDEFLGLDDLIAGIDPRQADPSFAFSVSEHSTATTAIHSFISSQANSSGKGKARPNNKRDAPDDDDEDEAAGPSKNIFMDPGKGGPPQRAKEQLPCIFHQACCGKDAYISDLLRKLDTHASKPEHGARFICGDCYEPFASIVQKSSHNCVKHCVFPDCPDAPRITDNRASSVQSLRHMKGSQCPANKGRNRQRWRYIYALCRPQCDAVPEPHITFGVGAVEHAAHGTMQNRPSRQNLQYTTSQRLVECERLLLDAQRDNGKLEKENAQLRTDRDLVEDKNRQLRGMLKMCLDIGASAINPAVRSYIHSQCPEIDISEPKQLSQQPRHEPTFPTTPSSSLAGAARPSRLPQNFEQALPSPCPQPGQLNGNDIIYGQQPINNFGMTGYAGGGDGMIYNPQGGFDAYMGADGNNTHWPNGGGA